MQITAFVLALLFVPVTAFSFPEKYYQDKWCDEHGGITEYILPDNTRVDCLTDTMAVEFDWAKKWAEGYGQARYYAAVTGKRGVVVLIIGPGDDRFVRRLRVAAGNEVDVLTVNKDLLRRPKIHPPQQTTEQ